MTYVLFALMTVLVVAVVVDLITSARILARTGDIDDPPDRSTDRPAEGRTRPA